MGCLDPLYGGQGSSQLHISGLSEELEPQDRVALRRDAGSRAYYAGPFYTTDGAWRVAIWRTRPPLRHTTQHRRPCHWRAV